MATVKQPFARHQVAPWVALPAGLAVVLLVAVLGMVMALTGADFGCLEGGKNQGAAPAPTRSAERDIPPARLSLYREAGRRFDLDWTFLASIGAQECDHGSCRGPNPSGCAGPMQIAFVRGSACSPGPGPTLWEQYRVDGDGDGRTDVDDPGDAILTAARLLREAKGAPPAGAGYGAYRQAACNYYGACADAAANYADEVMARAVQYGFRGDGAPAPSDPDQTQPILTGGGPGACGSPGPPPAAGGLGQARRAYRPRRLAPLSPSATAGGGRETCDARIIPDVEYLARRYRVRVTDCYGIHSLAGEHPLGAAIDVVPADGDWRHVERLARDLGWSERCAAQGLRPACAKPPFRFIGYNGFPNHGDPGNCVPCAGGPHLHVSWQTGASPGQPANRPLTSYQPAAWIEVFSTATAARARGAAA